MFFHIFRPTGPMGYPIFGHQVRWGTPFLVDFWTHFGANLAPSWATLVQELVLDGLVGLREAQRILNFFFRGVFLRNFRETRIRETGIRGVIVTRDSVISSETTWRSLE